MIITNTPLGYRPTKAYIAFGGNTTHWWTKFLKKGFYHCLVILGNGYEWYIIDPVMHFTDFIIVKTNQIEKIFQHQGYKLVAATPTIPSQIKFFLRPYTCVETVKHFLGIQEPFIWTPYQLFCFLTHKKGKKSLTFAKKCVIV